MNGAWNLWDIKPPPICTVKTVLHFKELTGLNEITFHAFQTLRDLNHLHREAAILSRLLYKSKRIYRHDKGMQNLVKINQCLKKYLKLDMPGVLYTFKETLPFKFSLSASHAYLPTQQMLKWVLLKLQAFTQIFIRVTNLAKKVGVYFLGKSCLGWSLNLSLLIFSISARILSTSKYLVKKSIEWYNSLYKYLPLLQETSDFLPGYTLPTNLNVWLGPVDLSSLKKKSSIDEVFQLIDLAKDDKEDDDEDNEVKILHEKFMKSFFKVEDAKIDSDVEEMIGEETKNKRKGVKRPLEIFQYEDLGVPVIKEEKVLDGSRKKEKKCKDGKILKCLKKVKKTVKNYDTQGMSENPMRGLRKKYDNSFITID